MIKTSPSLKSSMFSRFYRYEELDIRRAVPCYIIKSKLIISAQILIQSDFITQASREDIFDSAWNNRLLDEVTETFIDSVNTFSKHPTLQYHWLRYVQMQTVADDVWGRLQSKLFKRLASWEIFRASDESGFRKAIALREIPCRYRGVNQDALLPDLPKGPSAYVSES